jgi:DNA-binding LacI/PurR family transcriptional regulator
MKEVAAFLGVHYVTVSRALAQAETPRSGREMSECKT